MPALHLLVTATELAIKAFLIRSDKSVKTHTLSGLYEGLDCEHRKEIERRFSDSGPNSEFKEAKTLMVPTVKNILGMYDNTYGGESSVYMDTLDTTLNLLQQLSNNRMIFTVQIWLKEIHRTPFFFQRWLER